MQYPRLWPESERNILKLKDRKKASPKAEAPLPQPPVVDAEIARLSAGTLSQDAGEDGL